MQRDFSLRHFDYGAITMTEAQSGTRRAWSLLSVENDD
ncbi:MAG: hypothetical protein ACUVQH_09115 [Thermogutta sp.]